MRNLFKRRKHRRRRDLATVADGVGDAFDIWDIGRFVVQFLRHWFD